MLVSKQAKRLIDDKLKAGELLNDSTNKASSNKGKLAEIWDKLQLLIQLFRAWLGGEYKDIPKKTLMYVAAGLLYFVIPTDAIPDFLIGAGFLDDATVIAFIYSQISKELERFKSWQQTKTTIIE